MQVREIQVESRYCETCGADNSEELWSYTHLAKTRSYTWKFPVKNVICSKCGFVYVSPSPTMESLNEYYGDSFSRYMNQRLDYNVNKRIEFIKQNLTGTNRYIEIGANAKTEFFTRLCSLFKEVKTIEPNNSVESDLSSLAQVDGGSVDMIAHYFVLEHIPKVKDFLEDCFIALEPGGVMICEVPLIDYYSSDISALMLYEHVNHFSVSSLTNIAHKIGFKLLSVSTELCSRSFGFTTAFVKDKNDNPQFDSSAMIQEYIDNKNYFNKGKQLALEYYDRANRIYDKIVQLNYLNEKVIVWAANDNFLRLFSDNRRVLPNVVVIDSNPGKKNYIAEAKVLLPNEALEEISKCKYIIICTKLHREDILNSLKMKFDKEFISTNIFTFDY